MLPPAFQSGGPCCLRESFVLTSHSGFRRHPPFQRSEFPLSPQANFGPQAARATTSPTPGNIYTPELDGSHAQILQPSSRSSLSMVLSLTHHNYTVLSPNNVSLRYIPPPPSADLPTHSSSLPTPLEQPDGTLTPRDHLSWSYGTSPCFPGNSN